MLARGTLRRLFCAEARRSVLRVENQNRTWSQQELDRHAEAFSLGIQELGFKPSDKLVTWLDPKHGSEIVTIQLGCLKSGVTLVPIMSESPVDFFKAVSSSGAKGAIISPNRRVNGNQKISESILHELEELKKRN
jgi:acyl-CoA synthetase (AMP-forming)/AMP-acid ligase II